MNNTEAKGTACAIFEYPSHSGTQICLVLAREHIVIVVFERLNSPTQQEAMSEKLCCFLVCSCAKCSVCNLDVTLMFLRWSARLSKVNDLM